MRQYKEEHFHLKKPHHPQIKEIDKQICALLQERKIRSEGNPGIPSDVVLKEWADQFQLEEEMLYSIFFTAYNEEMFKPVAVPTRYEKSIPLQKWYEKDAIIYSIASMQQYENASVLVMQTTWDESRYKDDRPIFTTLDLGSSYQVTATDGVGSSGTKIERFVVFPRLPDDLSTIKISVKELSNESAEAGPLFEWV